MLGLNTATLGLRATSLFGSLWIRVAVVALSLAALAFGVFHTISTVKQWQTDSFNEGYKSGVTATNTAWEQIAADNQRKQIEQDRTDANRKDAAIVEYMKSRQSTRYIVDRTTKEVSRYEKSPAGAKRCVDGDGMRALLEERSALGLAVPSPSVPKPTARVYSPMRP